MTAPIFGIDLGTTNSLIGMLDAGFPILFAHENGSRLLPSAVHFLPDGNFLPGAAALRRRALAPERTITSIKRLMGLAYSEVEPTRFAFPVVPDAEGMAAVKIGDRIIRPEEISALLLGELKRVAEAATGAPAQRAVITVPAYFRDSQRAATRRAGELAGWQVERIVAEPTAAALAYGWGDRGRTGKIAVFDLGGGTFDLSILELAGGVFEVLATCGDTALGGDDIDRLLTEEIIRRLGLQEAVEGDVLLAERIREEAIAAKLRLSTENETTILLPFAGQANAQADAGLTLTRAELEHIAQPVLDRIPPLCRRALHDAGVELHELSAVLLVGGATRMPAVRKLAAEIFDRAPDTTQHPDEAVAAGACLQGAILAGAAPGFTLLDVTPLSLGIETFGGLMNVLIPRNTSIPCKAGEMFTNAVDGQRAMRVTILQGEREMARDNWKLGEFTIEFAPAPRGTARVGVEFTIDADGILQVLARDIATGREHVVKIESAVRIEDTKVEEMVNASVEHAFEDMNERIFTEAAIKARELLAALDAAFAQLGTELPAGEREEITELARRTRECLAEKNARVLKELVAQLDEKTEPLAALLLEKLLGDADEVGAADAVPPPAK